VVSAVAAHPDYGVAAARFAVYKLGGDAQGVAHGQAQQGGAGGSTIPKLSYRQWAGL